MRHVRLPFAREEVKMWEPAKIVIAILGSGQGNRAGYIYRGLGLFMALSASPKGRRPPKWCLTHLNSGHSIAWISGFVKDAFPIASEIAECGDWDFAGLDGWRNQDPELPRKVLEIAARFPKRVEMRAGGGGDREVAAAISSARAMASR